MDGLYGLGTSLARVSSRFLLFCLTLVLTVAERLSSLTRCVHFICQYPKEYPNYTLQGMNETIFYADSHIKNTETHVASRWNRDAMRLAELCLKEPKKK